MDRHEADSQLLTRYNIMKLLLSAVFSVLLVFGMSAQDESPYPRGKKGYEQTYKRNIKKSRINGVYIPKNLEEAFMELDALSPEGAKTTRKMDFCLLEFC